MVHLRSKILIALAILVLVFIFLVGIGYIKESQSMTRYKLDFEKRYDIPSQNVNILLRNFDNIQNEEVYDFWRNNSVERTSFELTRSGDSLSLTSNDCNEEFYNRHYPATQNAEGKQIVNCHFTYANYLNGWGTAGCWCYYPIKIQ